MGRSQDRMMVERNDSIREEECERKEVEGVTERF